MLNRGVLLFSIFRIFNYLFMVVSEALQDYCGGPLCCSGSGLWLDRVA